MTRPGRGGRPAAGSRCGLAALLSALLVLSACGGGGGGISFDPAEETPTRLTSPDGRIIAIIPAGALAATAQLTLTNRSSQDAAIAGPAGRSLVMAFEFSATVEPVEEEPPVEEPLVTAAVPGNGASQAVDPPAAPVLAEAAELTLLLPAALPAAMSIPLYTFNAVSLRYEDAELSGTVSEDGAELTFSLDRFGRFAFYSLLPEEIPPAPPTGLSLIAASSQIRKLQWNAAVGGIIAGVNLYRAPAGGDSFTKLNSDPWTVTVYSDELPEPAGYDYYLTAQNTAGLESDPSPIVNSPAVDFDIIQTYGWDRMVSPGDLALSAAADMLLIVDAGVPCVWVYSLDGRQTGRITEHLGKALLEPAGVAISPDGSRIYITDAGRKRVNIYNSDLTPVTFFGAAGAGPGKFTRPTAIEVIRDAVLIGDVVLVVDEALSTLQSFTGLGVYLDTLATFGSDDGQLDTPAALLADHTGNSLFISDSANARVQVFNSDLEYESSIVLTVETNGPLIAPLGLARDFRERLYCADSGNQRVVVFDAGGERLFHFGADGDLRVEFSGVTGPSGLALDPTTGYLYVSDPGNKRIVVFSS